MYLSNSKAVQKQRGTSVPIIKRRQEKVKKSAQQSKIELNQFESPKQYTIHKKRKNRGFSNDHKEEINSLILSIWENHYIEYDSPKKGGKQSNQGKKGEQSEIKQEKQGNEDPEQHSNSSIQPNIMNQEFQIFQGYFYFEFIEDALQSSIISLQKRTLQELPIPLVLPLLLIIYYVYY